MEGKERSDEPRAGDDDGDGQPRAGGGCAPLPVVERLIGHMKTEAYEGPGESLIGTQLISHFDYQCAEAGRVNKNDGTLVEWFLQLSEQEMRVFLIWSFLAFWPYLRRSILDLRATGRRLEFEAFLDTALYMAVRGNVRFLTFPFSMLCRAVGPRPTPEQQQRILERIRSDRELQLRVLAELVPGDQQLSAGFDAETWL